MVVPSHLPPSVRSLQWTAAHIFISCQIIYPCWRLQVGVQVGLGPMGADLGVLPPAGET